MTSQTNPNHSGIESKPNLLRWLTIVLLAILLVGAVLSAWVTTTTAGLQWLLSTTSKISSGAVQFNGVTGTFNAIQIKSIHVTNEDQQFKLSEFKLYWQPSALFSRKLKVSQLSAHDVEILAPSSADPFVLPERLDLPFALTVRRMEIAALQIFSDNTGDPDFIATELSASLESDGQQHQVSTLHFISEYGTLSASATLEGSKPFNLSAQAKLIGLTEMVETPLSETSISTTIRGNLAQLTVTMDAMGEVLNGEGELLLQPFATFPIAALRLSMDGLNPQLFSPDAPRADFMVSIDSHENHQAQLAGNLLIKNKLAKPLDQGGLPLHEIKTNFELSPDSVQLHDLSLSLTDNGLISGNFSWHLEQARGTANLQVQQLNPLALDTRLHAAQINGQIKLDGDTEKQHGIIALKDKTFSLDAQLIHTTESIILQKLQLRRNQSELIGEGQLNLEDQPLLSFKGQLKHFNLADFIQAPDSNLNAQVKLAGKLHPQPSGSLSFKLENSQFAEQPVAGHGEIEFKHIDHAKAAIEFSIGSNHLRAHGAFGAANDRMQLEITAPVLAQIGLGIEGALKLQASLGGSFASPIVQVDITGDHLSLPGRHQLAHVKALGNIQDNAIQLDLLANNYRTAEETQLQQMNLSVTGHQSNHQIQANLKVNEDIHITLQATGGIVETKQIVPTFHWAGILSELSATGPLPLNLLTATKLEIGADHAALDTTKLSVGSGEIIFNNTRWTPREWHSQGQFTRIALRPGSDSEVAREALQMGGTWHVTAAEQLTGSLQIAREKGDWILPGELPFPLGLQQLQFTAHANNGTVTGALTAIGKHIGTTQATISLPLTLSDSGWTILPTAALDGQISIILDDMSRIGALLNDNIESGGRLNLQAKLSGSFKNPEFAGNVLGTNLTFALLDEGVRLQHGKLDAHFDHASLHINTFNFTAPFEPLPLDRLLMKVNIPEQPGSLEISGVIGLIGNDSNLNIKLDHLPMALPSHHWIVASGHAQANVSANILTLSGNIAADAGFLIQPPTSRPQLANDIIISGQSTQKPQGISVNLDANIDLGKQFYLRAAGLEGRLTGGLHLRTDDQNNLTATGTIATQDAKYMAYGQQLTVERGIVNFNGPLDDPGLNILAKRNDVAIQAGVEISGSVRRPAIRLTSTPEVSDAEKLSWIVFGRSLSSGNVDTSLLLSAASSILGGQSSGEGLTQQLSQALGVDEISVRQGAGDGSPLTSQIGTIGKRISSRAYISYERGLTAANIGITKLTYELTPKVNVVTQAGLDSAVDVFYIFQFD